MINATFGYEMNADDVWKIPQDVEYHTELTSELTDKLQSKSTLNLLLRIALYRTYIFWCEW